jgi:hypothetical protein
MFVSRAVRQRVRCSQPLGRHPTRPKFCRLEIAEAPVVLFAPISHPHGGYTVTIYGSNTTDGIDGIQFEYGGRGDRCLL